MSRRNAGFAPGAFEAMAHDLRVLLRELLEERAAQPTAVIIDSRTVHSTPESGARAGYDGHKRRKAPKSISPLTRSGACLLLKVTAANEQERAQVAQLAQELHSVTGQSVEVAFVDQGCTGAEVAAAAAQEGIRLEVVKLHEAKHGFVLLPRRWVVERSFAWSARFRRLARDYERLAPTFASFHWLAFACLLLRPLFP